jgi:hypothetical protein
MGKKGLGFAALPHRLQQQREPLQQDGCWIVVRLYPVNGGYPQMPEVPDWDEEIVYPRPGDTLFQRANVQNEKILFAEWLAGDWAMYPDGYKMAADMVVDTMTGHAWEDRLILPIIFMYRHYVELKIKHIILELDRLSGTRIDTDRFRKHNLQSLWQYLIAHLNCIRSEPNKEIMSATERLINELEYFGSGFHALSLRNRQEAS